MRLVRTYALFNAAILATLLLSLPAGAQESAADPLDETGSVSLVDDDVEVTTSGWPRFSFALGAAWLDADGVLGARPPNRPPVTIINFDRIGLDESDASHWFSMTWRSRSDRWGLWFANWRYDVTGNRVWEDEFEISPGEIIPVGASVESEFDANWFIGEVTYSFVQNRKVDAGIGIGLHTVDLDTQLTARVNVGENEFEVVSGDLDTVAPLPNILAYVYWDFHPRWNLVARLGWFGLSYDKYDGEMTNAHAMLTWEMTPRFSIGAAYQFVRLDLDIERSRYQEIYDIDFSGPMAFLRFAF